MRLGKLLLCAASALLACDFGPKNSPTASSDGVLVTATISDGTGTFSQRGQTTVEDYINGQVQVSIYAIEAASPGRQISILVYCNPTDVGVDLTLNDLNADNQRQGGYGNTSQGTMGYTGPAAGTSGTIRFDNLVKGTNTISGTFSFVAIRPTDNASVSVTNGTFGK